MMGDERGRRESAELGVGCGGHCKLVIAKCKVQNGRGLGREFCHWRFLWRGGVGAEKYGAGILARVSGNRSFAPEFGCCVTSIAGVGSANTSVASDRERQNGIEFQLISEG